MQSRGIVCSQLLNTTTTTTIDFSDLRTKKGWKLPSCFLLTIDNKKKEHVNVCERKEKMFFAETCLTVCVCVCV